MPVIGGRAHINGITFATSTHVIRGKMCHGELTINVQCLPNNKILKTMDKIPFVRGISKLAKINLKIFFFIVVFLAMPWDWLFPSQVTEATVSIGAVLATYAFILMALIFFLKRLWQYHGAEHKAFNVYTQEIEFTLSSVKEANRVSERCGTNLVVILLPLMYLLSFFLAQFPLLLYLVSLSIGYEIFNWSSRHQRLKPVFIIAGFIQKYIVTAEPTEEQLKLAIATLSKAIEYEENRGPINL